MRAPVSACAVALAALAITAAPAAAAPQANHGLTIHAAPRTIIAGEPVVIFGHLASGQSSQLIRLYHHIARHPGFSLISVTHTNSRGDYEFTRAENIVQTNRSWFVRGPSQTHSRTVHERVGALVSLAASSPTATTRHAVTFTGHVTPNHRGSAVLLQVQRGSSDDWRTLKRGFVGAGSDFQIPFAWRTPGPREVRVLFRGDARNVRSASDPVTVVVQQTEVPSFTIATNDPVVADGQPATISGTLYMPGSTSTPEPGTLVQLFGREPGRGHFRELQATTTDASGNYSFTVASATNRWYQVRTAIAPKRATAQLFEGVQDAVTMSASSSSSTTGGHIRFTGTVSPDKTGHVIYLQKRGADSDWHTVETRTVHHGSTFSFGWTFGTAGVKQFRARITGGPANVGGASAAVPVFVTSSAS